MRKKHNKSKDRNDPIQDLVDWEEHRYDPGFWPSEWFKKARLDPEIFIWKRANLSSFWRTLLIYPIIGSVLTGPIVSLHDEIPHARSIVIAANILAFLGTWYMLHKWMVKAAKKKHGKRKDNENA